MLRLFSHCCLALGLLAPLPGADLLDARYHDAGDWLSYDRDNSCRRYSPLAQIDTSNVQRLAAAWGFQFLRLPPRSEATPLVRNGILYVTVGGEQAYALDARTGRRLWEFNYAAPEHAATGGKGRPRTNWNRGFALSGNRLFMATDDCSLLALDARNGSLLWRVQLADPAQGFNTTAAPLAVKNLVLLGVRGGDLGSMRGFIDAYDSETGKRAWRFETIPAPGQPGAETWPATDVWKRGGGATWTAGSYDPDLNLVYWPVGNPGPKDYDGRDRAGDNLYTCSLVALNADSGRLAWHYQFTPHDTHDWDASETPVLVDATWKGKPRKLVIQANRNAFFYVLDRERGELLLAAPFAKQTWAKGIGADGRPELLPGIEPTARGTRVCPDVHGGTNWEAPAYNPQTGLFYVMARDSCGIYYPNGFAVDADSAPRQSLKAIDIRSGAIAWSFPFEGSVEITHAGAMTTAGGLVFFASREGEFIACDAKTGKLLWHFNTGGSVRASPMSYMVHGRQYVAIVTKTTLFSFALPDAADKAAAAESAPVAPAKNWTAEEDHRDMMEQLGIRALRPGRSPRADALNHANYDEAQANPFPDYPAALRLKNGEPVRTAAIWFDRRRPEIVEDFEREVYGRVPPHVPKVTWTATKQVNDRVGAYPVIAKELVGHVDNSSYPAIGVDIQMVLVTPAWIQAPVPVMVMFGRAALPSAPLPPALARFAAMAGPDPPATEQLIAHGWGYAYLNPASIQADNGAGLTRGIIGLVNRGQPRQPDDWGALRAWAWGASRALDYLETDRAVDARHVGIEGVSRFGKAALVTMAFDTRFAAALVGSSGEGGAKPHRRNFGEALENLTATGEYHWMAGNFLKYGAAEASFGSRNAGDLPVDANELIALCAPRLTFISYGVPEKGDAQWLDHQGSFMATVAAGAVFRLLAAKDPGVGGDYRSARMPAVNTGLLDGRLAWRQHDGGHTDGPNWKYFIGWADKFLRHSGPAPPAASPR